MIIDIFIVVISIFFIIMVGVYVTKYRELPIDVYKPGAAWNLALIYFAFCNIISALSGTLETLLKQPIATRTQSTDPMWIILGSFCFIYIFFAYWILWARMTLTFDRKLYIGSEVSTTFGV